MEIIEKFINDLISYAINHGVKPPIFLAIYIVSFPFYYFPIFQIRKIIKKYKKNKNKKIFDQVGNFKNDIIAYIIINRVAWVSPYVYVLIWGRDLPVVVVVLMFIYIISGLVLFIYKYKGVMSNGN